MIAGCLGAVGGFFADGPANIGSAAKVGHSGITDNV
jgi:hypothetical protein